MGFGTPISSAQYPADKINMFVPNLEKFKEHVDFAHYGEGFTYYSRQVIFIPLQSYGFVMAGLSDNANTFTRNLRSKFNLFCNVTDLT